MPVGIPVVPVESDLSCSRCVTVVVVARTSAIRWPREGSGTCKRCVTEDLVAVEKHQCR